MNVLPVWGNIITNTHDIISIPPSNIKLCFTKNLGMPAQQEFFVYFLVRQHGEKHLSMCPCLMDIAQWLVWRNLMLNNITHLMQSDGRAFYSIAVICK